MTLNTRQISLFFVMLLLSSLGQYTHATHISEPVLSDPVTDYVIGEKIMLKGWVNYNNQPTADVLLNFEVTGPDGAIVTEQSYPSDSNGHFIFELDTNGLIPGRYQVTITSHCLEIHRHICTYKNLTVPVKIIEKTQQ